VLKLSVLGGVCRYRIYMDILDVMDQSKSADVNAKGAAFCALPYDKESTSAVAKDEINEAGVLTIKTAVGDTGGRDLEERYASTAASMMFGKEAVRGLRKLTTGRSGSGAGPSAKSSVQRMVELSMGALEIAGCAHGGASRRGLGFDGVTIASSCARVPLSGPALTAALDQEDVFGMHQLGPIFKEELLHSGLLGLQPGSVLLGATVYSLPDQAGCSGAAASPLSSSPALKLAQVPGSHQGSWKMGDVVELKTTAGGADNSNDLALCYVEGYDMLDGGHLLVRSCTNPSVHLTILSSNLLVQDGCLGGCPFYRFCCTGSNTKPLCGMRWLCSASAFPFTRASWA
jgi:hypothetical protein